MKRVLFVDDDPGVLSGLRRMLRPKRHEWDMSFLAGGDLAIAELERSSFDVVVTDMRMPRVDGAMLLTHLRTHHPETIRIVLSGHTDHAAALRSVPVAHRFLSKPCDPDVVIYAVEEACGLERRLTSPELRKLVGEVANLPSPTALVLRLNEALSDPNPDIGHITELINRDPAISAKLLQLVNSSFFGLAQQVISTRHAISYLGANLVRSVVIASEIFERAQGLAPAPFGTLEALQGHCLAVAQLAAELAPAAQRQEAFIAGLLHGVGSLALAASAPELVEQVREMVSESRLTLSVVEAEQALLGVTHADVGAYLLSLWGLPYPIIEAVAHHHDAPSLPSRTPGVVHSVAVADAVLDAEREPGTATEARGEALDPTYLEELGLTDAVAARAGRG